ncbi:hypothetical protein [Mycobacterium avium]|uniref:hypothetical protein n=1 Tax=Mycobacterium avium TaxID=1764 RepID=UPI00079FF4DE|nr:hypothetical protein [Mycobacterium avium]
MTTADSRDPDALLAADGQQRPRRVTGSAQRPGERQARNPLPRLRFPRCESCGEQIRRKGYARTSIVLARERGRYRRRHRDHEPLPLVPWHFMHAACDPGSTDPAAYFIGVGAARTARGMLVEVLKLTSRDWANETDWRPMVAAILAENRPPPSE